MLTFSIVGAFYRPPAQAILSVLPSGAKLFILSEPENPYDPKAIAIYVNSKELSKIDKEVLESALEGSGTSPEDLFLQPSWPLGYIPRNETSQIHPHLPEEGLTGTFLPPQEKGSGKISVAF